MMRLVNIPAGKWEKLLDEIFLKEKGDNFLRKKCSKNNDQADSIIKAKSSNA